MDIFKCREHWLFGRAFEGPRNIVFGNPENRTRECQYTNQVWNRHQSIKGIRDIPREIQVHRGAKDDKDDKDDFVEDGRLGSE